MILQALQQFQRAAEKAGSTVRDTAVSDWRRALARVFRVEDLVPALRSRPGYAVQVNNPKQWLF